MSRFEFQMKDQMGAALVAMSGSIDEDVDFGKIAPNGSKLLINRERNWPQNDRRSYTAWLKEST